MSRTTTRYQQYLQHVHTIPYKSDLLAFVGVAWGVFLAVNFALVLVELRIQVVDSAYDVTT